MDASLPSFVNPSLALAGVLCVALPILIHILLRRRRRPTPWAAMVFLARAYKQQRQRMRLEQLLILLIRCLLVAALGLAFGRPLLGAAASLGRPEPRTLVLLIDNSMTAAAQSSGTDALSRHKARALRMLGELDAARGDRAGVLTLGAPASTLVWPPAADLGAVAPLVEKITSTHSAAQIPEALDRVRRSLVSPDGQLPGRVVVALLSDLRAGSADTTRPLAALEETRSGGPRVRVVAPAPAPEPLDNTSVVDLEPLRPVLVRGPESGQESIARVTLRRSGPSVGKDITGEVRARWLAAGPGSAPEGAAGQVARSPVRWGAGQETQTLLVRTPPLDPEARGAAVLAVSLEGDAIAADNTAARIVLLREDLRVVVVAPRAAGAGLFLPGGMGAMEAADWVTLALTPSSSSGGDAQAGGGIRVERADPVTLSERDVGLADAVIVTRPEMLAPEGWALLRRSVEGGGVVMVTPGPGPGAQLWSDAFASAFGLNWTMGREPRAFDPPVGVLAPRGSESSNASMIRVLEPELAELLKPVRVSRAMPLELGGDGPTPLLRLADGSPLLVAVQGGAPDGEKAGRAGRGGKVVLWTAAPQLSWTTLPAMPLMVPLMQELVRQGVGDAAGALAGVAGRPLSTPAGTADLRPLLSTDGEASAALADGSWLGSLPASMASSPGRAGLWRCVDARGGTRGFVAVNPDPSAGRTEPLPRDELAPWLSTLAGGVAWLDGAGGPGDENTPGVLAEAPKAEGGSIETPLLAAAVLLALLDLVLGRVLSHAWRPAKEAA